MCRCEEAVAALGVTPGYGEVQVEGVFLLREQAGGRAARQEEPSSTRPMCVRFRTHDSDVESVGGVEWTRRSEASSSQSQRGVWCFRSLLATSLPEVVRLLDARSFVCVRRLCGR